MSSKKVTMHTHAINHSRNTAGFCPLISYEKSLIQWTTVTEPFQHWELRRGYTLPRDNAEIGCQKEGVFTKRQLDGTKPVQLKLQLCLSSLPFRRSFNSNTYPDKERLDAAGYAAMISVSFWQSWPMSATIQRICRQDKPLYKKWDVQTVVLHTNATPGIKNVLQWTTAD